MSDLTSDTFMNGRILITQPRRGYRFSIDAIILAFAISPKVGDIVIDIGTGCGIMPIILAFRYPEIRIFGIEVQKELAELAIMNIAANRMQGQIGIFHDDVRGFKTEKIGASVDWIISNPPYRRENSGRMNPDEQRALARHEINLNLSQLMQSVSRLLRTGGRFTAIYTAERTADLVFEMRAAGIEPKQMQSIHSKSQECAKLVLMQGIKGANCGMTIDRPLIIYRPDGYYTDTVLKMMSP
jgi:tRNA1Val (adenine37-N6)-methyltransferase